MAKRTRVPARRSPNRKTARQAQKDAHQAQPAQSAIRGAPKWRPPGVSIEYTPELLENARQRFEETDELAPSIAADMGIHPRTLSRLAVREGWKRRRQPRDLLPAARQLLQAKRLEAAECSQLPEQTALPQRNAEEQVNTESVLPTIGMTVEQTHRTVLGELAAVRTMRAALKREPQSPIDAQRTASTLARLTDTLQKLQRLQCATPPTGSHDDDIPTDINEFRRELAHRISAFVESRTGGGDAGASDA